jgi:hypothetical protein
MNRIIVFIALMLICCGATFGQQSQAKITGKEKHDIKLTDAAAFTKKFQAAAAQNSLRAGLFGREIIDRILAQRSVKGLRIYNALKADGASTYVIVGVDSSGNDLKAGILGEEIIPCPPLCGAANELNGKR